MKVTNLTSTVRVVVLTALATVLLIYRNNDSSETPTRSDRPRPSTMPVSMAVSSQDKERELRSPVLSQDIIDNVRIFFIFLGYPRSGHTILGALMDAHPNMVISHQYNPCVRSRLSNKTRLFNEMYRNSYKNAIDINGARSQNHNKKNYTAYVANSWQGNYDKYIRIIGDKGPCNLSPDVLDTIHRTLQTAVKSIIPVRNPFDLISTGVLYQDRKGLVDILHRQLNVSLSKKDQQDAPIVVTNYKLAMKELRESGSKEAFQNARYDNPKFIEKILDNIAGRTSRIMEQASMIGLENVLKIHNMDVVNDPLSAVTNMCAFFKVQCSQMYIKSFIDKVFESVSKTRELVVWPPSLRDMVETKVIKKYDMFSKYSFDTD
jgi:hypothetical protein